MPIRPLPHPSRPPTSSGALVPPTIGRLYSVRTNFSVKFLDFVQLSGSTRSRPTFPPPALSLRQTAWVVLKERIFACRTRLPPLILDVPWIPTIELMWDPWVMSASGGGGTCTALTDSTYSHNVVGQLMGQRSQAVPSVGPVEDYPRWVSEQGKRGVATVPAKGTPSLSVRSPDEFYRHGGNVCHLACGIGKCLRLVRGHPCKEPQLRPPALCRVQGHQMAVFMSRNATLLRSHSRGR